MTVNKDLHFSEVCSQPWKIIDLSATLWLRMLPEQKITTSLTAGSTRMEILHTTGGDSVPALCLV